MTSNNRGRREQPLLLARSTPTPSLLTGPGASVRRYAASRDLAFGEMASSTMPRLKGRVYSMTQQPGVGTGGTAAVRVLHVSTCIGGGVPQAIMDHITAMPEQDHHVLWPSDNDHLEPSTTAKKHQLPSSTVRAVAQIRSTIKAVRPQIVFAHSSVAGVLMRLLPQTGYSLVYQPHGYAFEAPHRPKWQRVGIRRVEMILAGRAKAVIGITQHELLLSKQLGARLAVLVPNCSHALVDEPSPQGDPPTSGEVRVVAVGRIAAQKDPRFFAQVAQAATSQNPSITFRWIGDGDAELRSVLTDAGVRVTGWTTPASAWQLMSTASLYVHTAAYEGFPLTVLDAAKLGLPLALRHIPAFDGLTRQTLADVPQMTRFILKFAEGDITTQDEARRTSHRVATTCTVDAQRRHLQELYSQLAPCTEAHPPTSLGVS